eukprot:CAMPEP_0206247828 /NCGR_PEP_ID=MMETSP0047_2-20121206/20027_1 /ASSEMBLY_ACC=CAM_ASM_000192 /TAXON_ID=195065 /ORGANISM="Chroomonas mesostigmatica_cf, Strain CCMP1168" /LENGTH=224 /DNA_ID=CAMNT_0053673397 /DNA_START=22 /DNA_END=696 /DNA_ORIENTATION=+
MSGRQDFEVPSFMEKREISEMLFSEDDIKAKVKEIGALINKEYKDKLDGKPLIVIATLKGATVFFADLVRTLDVDHVWEFMSFSSYGMGSSSSGAVQMVLDLKMDIGGRDVLVVEDILDTGNTLKYMIKQLWAREPKSVKTVVLLHKTEMTIPGVSAEFIGWEIPNHFVVGYGLDFAQKYRGLPYIGVVAPWVYQNPTDEKLKSDGSILSGDVSPMLNPADQKK